MNSPKDTISKILAQHDIERYGFALISTPKTIEYYKNWLQQGFGGEMKYLEIRKLTADNRTS